MIAHTIRGTDTLRSLALEFLGDSARWQELADYNRLHPPYIEHGRPNTRYASGYVRVVRNNMASDLPVPAGWTFHTKPTIMGGTIKYYETIEDSVAPAGEREWHFHVRSTVPGVFGNVDAGQVLEAGEEFHQANITFEFVTNDDPIYGGQDDRVLGMGDLIYIPMEDSIQSGRTLMERLDELGGEDLLLTPEFGYDRHFESDGYGDIKSIRGLENIKQAVTERLLTEKGDLPLHPEYGTNIPLLIGKAHHPHIEKMAELEVLDALSYEDRITDVRVDRVLFEGTTCYIDVSYKPAFGRQDVQQVTVAVS